MGQKTTPSWLDDAFLMRAAGRTVREIADELGVSHTLVWKHLTPAGRKQLKSKTSPGERLKNARYMRGYRKRKALEK